jgi:hypothetical protein
VANGWEGFRIASHIFDPGEIGVVKHAREGRMLASPHHRARWCTDGGRNLVVVESHPPGMQALPVRQIEPGRQWLVSILLVGDDY